jgi:phytoene dehydrogenase-like protein
VTAAATPELSAGAVIAHADRATKDAWIRTIVARCISGGTPIPADVRRWARLLDDPEQAARENTAQITRVLLGRFGPEGQIDDAYARIAELEQRPPTPEAEAEIRTTLARLRNLQRAEAERMQEHFRRNSSFDPDRARKALRRAQELIRRHARPS